MSNASPKMIEVPEEHLLALRSWRMHRLEGLSVQAPPWDAIDVIIACLPKPIQVGSRVRTISGEGIVVAIDSGFAWLRYGSGGRGTWLTNDLEVIE